MDAAWFVTPTLVLLIVVGAMYFAAGMARKRLGIGSGTLDHASLRVVGKRQLEARKSLYVIELGGRYVLVGTGESSVNLIDHITAEEYELMLGSGELDEDADNDDSDSDSPSGRRTLRTGGSEQFATVGESFAWMLDKARAARSSRHADSSDDVQVVSAAAAEDRS